MPALPRGRCGWWPQKKTTDRRPSLDKCRHRVLDLGAMDEQQQAEQKKALAAIGKEVQRREAVARGKELEALRDSLREHVTKHKDCPGVHSTHLGFMMVAEMIEARVLSLKLTGAIHGWFS